MRGRLARGVAVPRELLAIPAVGGHGKVWRRVLDHLRSHVRLIPMDRATGRTRRSPLSRGFAVVLADGHVDLPPLDTPLVVQVHEAGWFAPHLRDTLDPEFYEYIATRTEAAVHAATRVITPSDAARRDICAAYGLDAERVHAVHHGVDSVFRPQATGGRELVASLNGGRDAPYVLFAAALHPRKNLSVLRDAMAALIAEGMPQVLVIAGGPATDRRDSSALERAAGAQLPGTGARVVRVPSPSDEQLAGLMSEADAFCLPSLYEGFGLTALEAMACGAPVVVSDRGALPEVVGEAGLVVSPTVEAVGGALRRLLVHRPTAEVLGRAAAERARAFTWERTAQGWLSVLRAAATSRPRSPNPT
jgi:glycosyltransferase involved in cell wall biosynthesis